MQLLIVAVMLSGCGDSPEQSVTLADYGIYDAALDKDGKLAVVATVDHQALIFDIANNQVKHHLQHQDNDQHPIIRTAISADGKIALTAEHQTFSLWQTVSGKTIDYRQMPANILDIKMSTDGDKILVGLANNQARLVDVSSNKTLHIFPHELAVNSVAITQDGRYSLTGSDDKTAKLWDNLSGKLLRNFTAEREVTFVALSPRNRYALVSAGQFQRVLWDITRNIPAHRLEINGELISMIRPAYMSISSTTFSDDGKTLWTGSPPGFIRQWSIDSGTVTASWLLPKRNWFKPPGSVPFALAHDKSNKTLTVLGSDGTGHIYSSE